MEHEGRKAKQEIAVDSSELHRCGALSSTDMPYHVPPLPGQSESPALPPMEEPAQYDLSQSVDVAQSAPPVYVPPLYTPPPPQYTPPPYAALRSVPYGNDAPRKNCLIAGMLGLFLGGLGAHRFYLGYYKVGAVMLVAGLLTPLLAWMHIPPVVFLWGFVEGILCFFGLLKDANGNALARW